MKYTKLLSLLFVSATVLGLLFGTAVTGNAKNAPTVKVTTGSSLDAVNTLKKKYPKNSYFSKTGKECRCHGENGGCSYSGGCDCLVSNGSIQCRGFADWVFYSMYGYKLPGIIDDHTFEKTSYADRVYILDPEDMTTANVRKVFTAARTGDVILCKHSSIHYVVVEYATANGIYVYEANYAGHCRVWEREITYAEFAKKYVGGMTLLRAKTNRLAANDVTRITFDDSLMLVKVSSTVKQQPNIYIKNGSAYHLTWSSSDTSVATVNQSGTVTGISAGNATITCRSNNGTTCTYIVKVVSRSTAITAAARLESALSDYPVGSFFTSDKTASGTPVEYNSMQGSRAFADYLFYKVFGKHYAYPSGNPSGSVLLGSADLSDKTAAGMLYYNARLCDIVSIDGKYYVIKSFCKGFCFEGYTLSDENGVQLEKVDIAEYAEGSISVYSATNYTSVLLCRTYDSLAVKPESGVYNPDTEFALTVTAASSYSDLDDDRVLYFVTDADVCSVDDDGVCRTLKPGHTVISVYAGYRSKQVDIYVVPEGSNTSCICFDCCDISVDVCDAESRYATPCYVPGEALEDAVFTYSSTNKSVAVVGEDGLIVPLSAGSCYIAAVSEKGAYGTCRVTVTDNSVTGIELDETSVIPDFIRGDDIVLQNLYITVHREQGDGLLPVTDDMLSLSPEADGTVTATLKYCGYTASFEISILHREFDMDGNGAVEYADAVYMLTAIMRGQADALPEEADIDGDGEPTTSDIRYLLELIESGKN